MIITLNLNGLNKQSSTFVAPETGFLNLLFFHGLDDDQAVMCGSHGGDGTGSNMSNAGGNASDE